MSDDNRSPDPDAIATAVEAALRNVLGSATAPQSQQPAQQPAAPAYMPPPTQPQYAYPPQQQPEAPGHPAPLGADSAHYEGPLSMTSDDQYEFVRRWAEENDGDVDILTSARNAPAWKHLSRKMQAEIRRHGLRFNVNTGKWNATK